MTHTAYVLTRINEVYSEIYSLIASANNKSHCVYGPYTRSKCYQMKKAAFNNGIGCRVFKICDIVDKYYLINNHCDAGENLYSELTSLRSLIRRLNKEVP